MIDEADVFIENKLICFKSDLHYNGLVNWRYEKVFLFSATLSVYWRKIIKIGLNMQDHQFLEAKPQLYLTQNIEDTVNINGETHKTFDAALSALLSRVSEQSHSQPVIVFATQQRQKVSCALS